MLVEVPSLELPDAHGPEVVRADDVELRDRLAPLCRFRLALDLEGRRAAISAEGHCPHERGGLERLQTLYAEWRFFDPGHRAQPLQCLAEERGDRAGLGVLRRRQAELGGQDVIGAEAQLGALEGDGAAQQQPGADEQHQRQGHLRDDEGVAKAVARGPAAAPPRLLQDAVEVGARGLYGRHETEAEAGGRGQDEREGHHPAVEGQRAREHAGGREAQQEGEAPVADEQAERPAQQGQHRALGEELAQEPRPARAEGRAHRQLAPPAAGASEKQVRHVGACDEEHQADRAEKDEERGLERAHDLLVERHDLHAPARVRVGICLLEPPRDDRHVGPRLAHVQPRPQAAEHEDLGLPAREPFLVREIGDRKEHVAAHEPAVGGRVASVELGPEDAHHRVALAVEHDAATEDPRVRSEAPLPQTVAEHGHRPRGGGVRLFGGEGATEGRPRAEQREEAVADEGPHDALGLGATGQVHALAPPCRHVRERVVLLAPVHELRPGGGGLRPARRARPQHDEPVRLGVGQRAKQDRVHDREHGGGAADAEGDGQRRDHGEPGALHQRPCCIAQVLELPAQVTAPGRESACPRAARC